MGNPLPKNTTTGTIGELLVQLRLLEYGVQAASPLRDSGNDLIAIKGEAVKFVQVKTSAAGARSPEKLPDIFHIVAIVELKYSESGALLLDRSTVAVYRKGEGFSSRRLLTQEIADEMWRA